VVDFHDTPLPVFARWMGVNHVRMDGQLPPRYARNSRPSPTACTGPTAGFGATSFSWGGLPARHEAVLGVRFTSLLPSRCGDPQWRDDILQPCRPCFPR
jgi:hypothetical protein